MRTLLNCVIPRAQEIQPRASRHEATVSVYVRASRDARATKYRLQEMRCTEGQRGCNKTRKRACDAAHQPVEQPAGKCGPEYAIVRNGRRFFDAEGRWLTALYSLG